MKIIVVENVDDDLWDEILSGIPQASIHESGRGVDENGFPLCNAVVCVDCEDELKEITSDYTIVDVTL